MPWKRVLHTAALCLLLSPMAFANGSDSDSISVKVTVEPFANLWTDGSLKLNIYPLGNQWVVAREGSAANIHVQCNEGLWIGVSSDGFDNESDNLLNDIIVYRVNPHFFSNGPTQVPVTIAPNGEGFFHFDNNLVKLSNGLIWFEWDIEPNATGVNLNNSSFDWTKLRATAANESHIDTITFTVAHVGDTWNGHDDYPVTQFEFPHVP